MRIDRGNKPDTAKVQSLEAGAPAEQSDAAEPAAHDHMQRAAERPMLFASSHIAEAGMMARVQQLMQDADATAGAPDPTQSGAPTPTATAPPDPSQTGAPSPTQSAAPSAPAGASDAPGPELDQIRTGGATLRRGGHGTDVASLQRALNAAGIQPPLDVDGSFGPKTVAAVRRFQQEHGCKVDGIVGPQTMGAIDQALGRTPNPAAAAATARYAGRSGGGASSPPGSTAPGSTAPGSTAPTDGTSAPATPSSGGVSGSVVDRIMDRTARFESGRRYDAWNADDNGHGVSFGLVQFNQQVGTLPTLFQRMHARDPERFNRIMGPHAQNLRNASWVRGANLNSPDIKRRIQEAGRDPVFQQVQRDVARQNYFDPAARTAREFGIRSERGLAMLFDSSIQNGVGGTRRFLRQAAQGGGGERAILERFARLADRGRANGRRARILADPSFSDAPPASAPPAAPTTSTAPPASPAATGTGPAGTSPAGTGSVAPTGATAPTSHGPPIGPGDRVLMIGDSHSVGTFGNEMDRLLRSTGATVESYGSSGSSPSWWLNGTDTHSGFVARHADGTTERPNWRSTHETPRLEELIRRHRPNVLMVSLGGNMRGLSAQGIRNQVERLSRVAQQNGVRLVWVGPPERRTDNDDPSSLARFNQTLRSAVAPYGTFVDSGRYTEYSGGDGVHYSGRRGNQVARGWAGSAFREIQGQG